MGPSGQETIQDVWEEYVRTRRPELRERLILQYTPLVRYVVGRMAIVRPALLDSDDILSEGTIGLMEAVDRFDPTTGVKFETYAISRIRGNVTDALRRADLLSRGALRRVREVEKAITHLHQTLQRPPTDREVIDALGITVDEYREALVNANALVLPLDVPIGNGADETLLLTDILPDSRFPRPEDALDRRHLLESLEDAIRQLPERDRLVLAMYYQEELTLREIGQALNVSESRVCQIHGRLILTLRRLLNDHPSDGDRCGRALAGARR
ncbi:MAG TPA: FliA/WhiG family RNA polymerase sigma factor [Dehalococcoidia bacterium]|nr:FliA/WhiG family RNA polymerase sigma factor [Dehalococcoidia bacterium]